MSDREHGRLGLILGDQLSDSLPTLQALDPQRDRLLLAEVPVEASYVPHHQQKIALIFSAMRHFAAQLRQRGWQVHYHTFSRDAEAQSLFDVVRQQSAVLPTSAVVVTEPGEYRLWQQMQQWSQQLAMQVDLLADTRFLCSHERFATLRPTRMEFFYRHMRRSTGLLMEDGKPVGGQWNFDADNRRRWRGEPAVPPALTFSRDASDEQVLALVAREFGDHPGTLDSFGWPTTREQALQALQHFIEHSLPCFGDFQDAMASGQPLLFHSLLSPALNIGLLTPMEVCQAAEAAWRRGAAPLNAVEGFIRQIIGWREYVRGIYWQQMPAYAGLNALAAQRPLPAYYWTADTRMRCMQQCIKGTLDNAYAHHIQRLMITGNFALLTGIAPAQVCDWYLAVYADAFEWVELPNTLGMAIHGDGGLMASKPYAASGSYINRMSDYCKGCHYRVTERSTARSCPFNSLYWHFIDRHREHFEANPRMRMVYRNLERMAEDERVAILARGDIVLQQLEEL